MSSAACVEATLDAFLFFLVSAPDELLSIPITAEKSFTGFIGFRILGS